MRANSVGRQLLQQGVGVQDGAVRCGVVWRGVAWCGAVWRGVAWHGVVWCDAAVGCMTTRCEAVDAMRCVAAVGCTTTPCEAIHA